jgi:NAD(P)-dependent dehydrogenase (short-subunit alcohol dehydrogenase family)
MNQTGRKVAIITGGSQGIGASLVAAYRRPGWGVVATDEQLGAVTVRRGWRRHSPPGAAGGRSRPTWVSRSANPTER